MSIETERMPVADAVKSGQHGVPKPAVTSSWSPFRHRVFTVMWIATLVSNIGTWMYNAGSGWLMTSLSADPLVISLVQVATSLPMFLFAMPAGAFTDIIDRRKFLIFGESATTLISAIFAALVWFDLVTPNILLTFMFLIGVGGALTAPAWQAIVSQLVPAKDLTPAVAANSVGVNISRAIGPALGGVMIGALGIAAPFWLNAVSNLATVGALIWWRTQQKAPGHLPAERFASAIRTGFRHARHNRHLSATLMRALGFFPFASAYWALLPLVTRSQILGGPNLYGILLGAIGLGAIGGAFALPWLKAKIGPDRMVRAGTVGTAVTLVLFGLAREPLTALLASVIAGASWIAVLASLNVSAQVALPDWVRGRGLAMFVTVMFAAMTAGSVIWGQVAGMAGLPVAHFSAAAGALVAIPVTWRWKLQTGAGMDLTPSMFWPAPVVAQEVENDDGPVLVTVEYRIAAPENRAAFLIAAKRLAQERGRDGAYAWGIFEDTAHPGLFLETFLVESWLEHLRQHERVTNADRVLQERLNHLLEGTPRVRHLITVGPGDGPPKGKTA
jgi:predicted MFS family arabinose efflux permease